MQEIPMAASEGSAFSGVCLASVDAIVGTIAGGLVILVFYPLTLCALGVKTAVRTMRPHLVNQRNPHISSTN
jgi:hypothetical protein